MSKIGKVICYSILIMVFLLTTIFMGITYFNQKKQEEEFTVRIEEARQKIIAEAKELEQEEQKNKEEEKEEPKKEEQEQKPSQQIDSEELEEDEEEQKKEQEKIVLVKTLPVFSSDSISKNITEEPKIQLSNGEIVSVVEEGIQYSLIKTLKGNISGYVWKDCIGEIPKSEISNQQSSNPKVIVIDAGHQKKANAQKEPIGPDAVETKSKVASGTIGVTTRCYEYEMTLSMALLLEKELEKRDYVVIQIRRENDVDISNAERAILANQIEADVLIRLHGNGSENSSVNGADTYYISEDNPYQDINVYEQSKQLAECVLDAYTEANEDINKNRTHETDEYTGLNWCEIPSIILEMGYLSNEKDDKYMNDSNNRKNMAKGIADGIDDYFEQINQIEEDSEAHMD